MVSLMHNMLLNLNIKKSNSNDTSSMTILHHNLKMKYLTYIDLLGNHDSWLILSKYVFYPNYPQVRKK